MSHYYTKENNTLALLSVNKELDTINVLNRGSICWSMSCNCDKGQDHEDTVIYLINPHWFERFCVNRGLRWIVRYCLGFVETRRISDTVKLIKKTKREDDASDQITK